MTANITVNGEKTNAFPIRPGKAGKTRTPTATLGIVLESLNGEIGQENQINGECWERKTKMGPICKIGSCCKVYLLNDSYLLKVPAVIQAPAPLSWIKMVPAPRLEHCGVPGLRPDWSICQFNQKRAGFW